MTPAPDRSLAQRRAALVYANEIRSFRSQLKVDVAGARVDADAVLVSREPRVDTMKAFDLVIAVPGMGRVKADKLFRRHAISPSKTIGGLSPRQRARLIVELRSFRQASGLYRARKVAA